ncbi:MAM domain-containing protein [Nephila pilipes]|uniref:MAM domain-containing protein n=1 Tax=Nephila pilipes TaxID=299642 RepID=A0A8X6QPX3_NEPPI|nr:MAM domain-containing protein [Nephila pilipes]
MINYSAWIRGLLLFGFQVILLLQCCEGISATSEILFKCPFLWDTCGMFNRPDSRALWRREYLSVGGRNGYAMVVRGNAANNYFARLQTPFLSTNDATMGCMRFRYFIDGRTPASLAVIKQGFVTEYIYTNARKTTDHWENAEIDFKILGDQTMFYFEADTKVQNYGDSTVAFADLRISTNSCENNHKYG